MISIAIDGPAGVGKSTVSRAVSRKLGFVYVDTGAFYRAVAFFCIKNNINPAEIDNYLGRVGLSVDFLGGDQRILLNGEDVTNMLRSEKVSNMASRVSVSKKVRDFLLDLQKSTASKYNVVMDGRDIGTVVLPGADVKIFLTASAKVRAERRYKELKNKGEQCDYGSILADILIRDKRDSERKIAPLKPASDAVIIDNSEYNLEKSINEVLKVVAEKLGVNSKEANLKINGSKGGKYEEV